MSEAMNDQHDALLSWLADSTEALSIRTKLEEEGYIVLPGVFSREVTTHLDVI